MTIYQEEIFGPVLSVVNMIILMAMEIINNHEFAMELIYTSNGTFTEIL